MQYSMKYSRPSLLLVDVSDMVWSDFGHLENVVDQLRDGGQGVQLVATDTADFSEAIDPQQVGGERERFEDGVEYAVRPVLGCAVIGDLADVLPLQKNEDTKVIA